jgi:hypothetical protein
VTLRPVSAHTRERQRVPRAFRPGVCSLHRAEPLGACVGRDSEFDARLYARHACDLGYATVGLRSSPRPGSNAAADVVGSCVRPGVFSGTRSSRPRTANRARVPSYRCRIVTRILYARAEDLPSSSVSRTLGPCLHQSDCRLLNKIPPLPRRLLNKIRRLLNKTHPPCWPISKEDPPAR